MSRTHELKGEGFRTHFLLVVAMALITALITALFLLAVRQRLHTQVTDGLASDLQHSVLSFRDLQQERFSALDRESSLLASLPTLKALMTSGDDLTIQDGATEYWKLSGDDLFALLTPDGRAIAVYGKSPKPTDVLRAALRRLVEAPERHYVIDGDSLYTCSVRPIYFGSDESGTLLGYLVSGISIERTVRQISSTSGVEATFVSRGNIVASTLGQDATKQLLAQRERMEQSQTAKVRLADVQYLSSSEDLSGFATQPLQLLVLKSFSPAELWIARIDRTILTAGLLALFGGTILMIALGRLLTGPLEELSRSVRAFGMGDGAYRVPVYGTQEVRQLSSSFARMREEIQRANEARLESERLATIGRMASSVSHDLRHYLSAVYANAEFLSSDTLSPDERAEIFQDIRTAVLGTADMIESLLIFSRTGASIRRAPESILPVLDHVLTLVRAHPDAHGVVFEKHFPEEQQIIANVDGKQLERAVYNLVLNACQAAQVGAPSPLVALTVEADKESLSISVSDNGSGVPDGIRLKLFEPFVSEGKQKGTGLGLTLVSCIAEEHGGEVVLASSRPGETVFRMKILLTLPADTFSEGYKTRDAHHEITAV